MSRRSELIRRLDRLTMLLLNEATRSPLAQDFEGLMAIGEFMQASEGIKYLLAEMPEGCTCSYAQLGVNCPVHLLKIIRLDGDDT